MSAGLCGCVTCGRAFNVRSVVVVEGRLHRQKARCSLFPSLSLSLFPSFSPSAGDCPPGSQVLLLRLQFAAPADGKLRTGAPPKCSKCCCCCCCLLCYSLCTDRLCILAAFVNGHDSVFCFLEHRVSSCRCRRQLVKEVVQ